MTVPSESSMVQNTKARSVRMPSAGAEPRTVIRYLFGRIRIWEAGKSMTEIPVEGTRLLSRSVQEKTRKPVG